MTTPGIKAEQSNLQPEAIVNPSGETLALRFDVLPLLETQVGPDWQQKISNAVEAGSVKRRTADGDDTNREVGNTAMFELTTAIGKEITNRVPELWILYQGPIKDLMQQALPDGAEPLRSYNDPEFAFEGYSQKPVPQIRNNTVQRRMEAHVDMRYTAILIVDTPISDAYGGRLVISNNADAKNVEEINRNATYITQRPGTLVCFVQGRKYPHYPEEITDPSARRIIVSLNYPVASETAESALAFLKYISTPSSEL